MSALSSGQLLPLAIAIIAAAMLSIVWFGRKLARSQPRDIRVVSYLFCPSAVATLIALIWARSSGVVDADGAFQGPRGQALHQTLIFMLDLNLDVKVFATLATLVLLPQALSYLMAGSFGCASAPIFVGRTFSFFVWSFVKSLTTAAGLVSAMLVYGLATSWTTLNAKQHVSLAFIAANTAAAAFFTLWAYREVHNDWRELTATTARSPALARALASARAWMTRHVARRA